MPRGYNGASKMDALSESDDEVDAWLEPAASLDAAVHSFIVVIRIPSASAATTVWRGSVEHVQTRTRIYFREFQQLDAFLAAQCGISAAD